MSAGLPGTTWLTGLVDWHNRNRKYTGNSAHYGQSQSRRCRAFCSDPESMQSVAQVGSVAARKRCQQIKRFGRPVQCEIKNTEPKPPEPVHFTQSLDRSGGRPIIEIYSPAAETPSRRQSQILPDRYSPGAGDRAKAVPAPLISGLQGLLVLLADSIDTAGLNGLVGSPGLTGATACSRQKLQSPVSAGWPAEPVGQDRLRGPFRKGRS